MTEKKTVETALAEGEAADLADKLETPVLYGSAFPLQPAWEDTVARFGYPPLGVPPNCEFHWADTFAELKAIHKALGLVAKPAKPVGRPRKAVKRT